MASLPFVFLTNMYDRAKAQMKEKGEAEVHYKEYTLFMDTEYKSIILEHYGTVIYRYVPMNYRYAPSLHGFDIGGARSKSDVDAINSMVMITGKGKKVCMRNGKIVFADSIPKKKDTNMHPFGL